MCLLAVAVLPQPAWAATLTPQTVKHWDAYVAATEARIERELASGQRFLVQDFSPDGPGERRLVLAGALPIAEMETAARSGQAISTPDGLVNHWRGSVLVPGVTLVALLERLNHPSEAGPHQQDVLALRVLERRADGLDLFIKMTRRKIVTVTYNTKHRITYRRYGPSRAASRSVATKIAELEDAGTPQEREKTPGEDRGFMWRLNSYWRYQETSGGVIVELESLTLSRDIPFGLGTLVRPLVNRVARESMTRTLESLRDTHAGRAPALAAAR